MSNEPANLSQQLASILAGCVLWAFFWSCVIWAGYNISWSWVFAPVTAPLSAIGGDWGPLIALIVTAVPLRLVFFRGGIEKV